MARFWQRFGQLRSWLLGGLAVAMILLLQSPTPSQVPPVPAKPAGSVATVALPPAQKHPLPATLAQWQDKSGDYFDQVQRTTPNYLIWSQFPVKIYIEPAALANQPAHQSTAKSATAWVTAMQQAVQEWTPYLPLALVDAAPSADIVMVRSAIPLRRKPGEPLRARSAETRFELYSQRQPQGAALLAHRVTVVVRPNQSGEYVLAAARHELGHALGIWGHSPQPTDSLYFSQVRHPPLISPRDVNTLKRVYEQATCLGWPIASSQ
jgi:predicted Zn-dependent protease